MRIRAIKPEFWRDPDTTGRWPADLKLFYIGLWMVADDDGRFAWDEDLIASDLYPFDRTVDVGALLQQLLQADRVQAYSVGGRRYGFIHNFSKHQKINRPTPSRLPPPPEGLTEHSLNTHGGLTAGKERKGSGIRDQGSVILDQGAGSGERVESDADAPAPTPTGPPSRRTSPRQPPA